MKSAKVVQRHTLCRECHGTGQKHYEERRTCPMCNNVKGYSGTSYIREPGGYKTVCKKCNSVGTISVYVKGKCMDCKGKGKIFY